jgi:hypothetical protein
MKIGQKGCEVSTLNPLNAELNPICQLLALLGAHQRLRWSRGSVLAFGTQVRWVQTRPKPSDFSGEKILSTPSFRGEVKLSVPCRALRHVKEPKSDMEVTTFGKILGHFSPIVPPSAAGFASVTSDAGELMWRKLEHSKSLILLQVGV